MAEFSRELSFRFPLARGEDVRAVQTALGAVNTQPPCGVADGIYGPATRAAVAGFQRAEGLEDDGIVGRRTWAALFARAKAKLQPATPAAAAVPAPRLGTLARAAGDGALGPDLLSRRAALRVMGWLMDNFGAEVEAGCREPGIDPPLDPALVAAIACKETATVWLGWTDRLAPAEVLARCVFDASGDMPGTTRGAFPRNLAEFQAKAGTAVAELLVAEANKTRRLRGMGPSRMLYKGYGIFQYDLQHFPADPEFFTGLRWGTFGECMGRLVLVMRRKSAKARGDRRTLVRMYNGSGPRAEAYAGDVLTYYEALRPAVAEARPVVAAGA